MHKELIMGFFEKIAFKIVRLCLEVLDNYRVKYYDYINGNKAELGDGIVMGENSAIIIYPDGGNANVIIGDNNLFRKSCLISLAQDGKMVIGENNFFNNGCSITCMSSIQIGKNNLFGEGVKIYDHNHIYSQLHESIREQGFSRGYVVIGDNCWFGSNCIILNNVTIGDNVIVGANNLIYKSIPSNSIVKSASQVTITQRD